MQRSRTQRRKVLVFVAWFPFFLLLLLQLPTFSADDRQQQGEKLAASLFSVGELLRSARSDLSENLLGRSAECSNVLNETTVLFFYDLVDRREWVDFYASSPTLTSANAALSLGLYKNASLAKTWLTKRRYHVVPNWHPRNAKRDMCLRAADKASTAIISSYASAPFSWQPYYTVRVERVLINPAGVVLFSSCKGYWQSLQSCNSFIKAIGRRWSTACREAMEGKAAKERALFDHTLSLEQEFPATLNRTHNMTLGKLQVNRCFYDVRNLTILPTRVKKIVILTPSLDSNFYHLLYDTGLRLLPFLDLLRKDSSVMVHMQLDHGSLPLGTKTDAVLSFLSFFGIDTSRIVRGVVVADEAWFTKSVVCSSPLRHSVELRALARTMLGIALGLPERAKRLTLSEMHAARGKRSGGGGDEKEQKKKKMILQVRSCGETCTERDWSSAFAKKLSAALRARFSSSHEVLVRRSSVKQTLAEDVLQYSGADVLVGLHGAGLTHSMFLPSGSVVAEITGYWDGRMLPLCGYFDSFFAAFGVHHYIFSFDSFSASKDAPVDFSITDFVEGFSTFLTQIRGGQPSRELVPFLPE